jgi:hypothetical protein
MLTFLQFMLIPMSIFLQFLPIPMSIFLQFLPIPIFHPVLTDTDIPPVLADTNIPPIPADTLASAPSSPSKSKVVFLNLYF